MRRLGLSIYPEKDKPENIRNYLKEAQKIGASRIFSCLLSATKEPEVIKKEFYEMNHYAHQLGYEVILDISPAVFSKLGISYQDLSFFKEIEADGIRLDQGFTGMEESLMTYNPQQLTIEINMSNNTHTLDTIMDYQPDIYHLQGCHNFYPHPYTGLTLAHFNETTKRFKQYGLKTAAFVGSQEKGSFGPWPVKEGLCTLEMHRHLPLDVQVKHYVAIGNIDDIIIANCYPSPKELEALNNVNLQVLNLSISVIDELPEIFEKVLFGELQMNRGDINENIIRSTLTRVKYRGENFPIINAPEHIHRGDILVESSEYGHYAGEVQIAKRNMINSGKTNVVGHIREEEEFLIDGIKPWQKFEFTKIS